MAQNSMSAAAIEQDRAAGGAERRLLRTRSGEIFTASLYISGKSGDRLVLRFKTGGYTVQRPIGTVAAPTRFETLRLGWAKVREERIVEKNHWEWVSS